MSNEQWSEWISWLGTNMQPLSDRYEICIQFRSGTRVEGVKPSKYRWAHKDSAGDIVAYRYRLDDNTMTEEEQEIPAEDWKVGKVGGSWSHGEDAELLQIARERMGDGSVPVTIKQLRYLDAKGEDWIDEFARTATADEFRGAMKFTIGKYLRRAGKKDDLVSEIEKMRDYCERWIAYERRN